MIVRFGLSVLLALLAFCVVHGAERILPETARGDRMIAAYFRAETGRLRDRCLADVDSLAAWKTRRTEYRQQLLEMLGLDPLPKRTDLKPTITGQVEREKFIVRKVHFQSRPGLYVTGNLYLPKKVDKPVPAVLYVCGHGGVKKNGISYGNKVHYQHHGSWLAQHGIVCLTIDSLQLGEIEAIHHGTYRYKMWWWNNRGYTPAGVEAWNCVRAIDYLQSLKEVDGERIGVTGRSGGGAYSWWIAAIDDRIKVAVPVAGITDLENHVVDGCVEGHCDCMFMVNTYRWDYPLVAALVAPRPLMIGNSDNDEIFPQDGVERTLEKVKKVYQLYGAADKLTLNLTVGRHKDTPELQRPAMAWLEKHLKGSGEGGVAADKYFQPEELRVLKKLPEDERNTKIHETFVAAASHQVPASKKAWETTRDGWRKALSEKSFRGWPSKPSGLNVKKAFEVERHGLRFSAYDFESQQAIRLRIYLVQRAGDPKDDLVVLNVLDEAGWKEFLAMMRSGFEKELAGEALLPADKKAFESERKMHQSFRWAMAYVAPRGIGPTAWDQSEKKQTQHRRRFMLLGQTLDGMRVLDVCRAVKSLRSVDGLEETPLWLQSHRTMAGVTLYASLYVPDVTRLDLHGLPKSHRDGPILLNVRRYLDLPQAVAMAAERSRVVIYQDGSEGWQYPTVVIEKFGWGKKRLQIRKTVAVESPK
jgi:dienelactone hydrolase